MTVLRLPGDIRERTVRDVLDERAVSRAGHVALIAPSLVHGGTVALTYAELHTAAGELAAVFAAAGVGKGDRVAIIVDNHGAAEAHVAYHASHRVGAINVPINARYVPARAPVRARVRGAGRDRLRRRVRSGARRAG